MQYLKISSCTTRKLQLALDFDIVIDYIKFGKNV